MTLNIVLATSQFLPDVYGGVETYTLGLAQEFQKVGHNVHIICTRQETTESSELQLIDDTFAEIPVRRVIVNQNIQLKRQMQRAYSPEIALKVKQAALEWKADVVHVTNFSALSAAIIPALRELGIPIIWTATDFGMTCARYILIKKNGHLCSGQATFHNCLDCLRPNSGFSDPLFQALTYTPQNTSYNFAKLAQKMPLKKQGVLQTAIIVKERLDLLPLLSEIDLILAPSSWMKEILIQNGVNSEKIHVSVYGIETKVSKPQFAKTTYPLHFGFIGRIHPMKGVDILIKAFNQLNNNQKAKLTIYGSPSPDQFRYAGQLWSLAKDNPHIIFGKQLNREQIPAAFEDLDILVVPSIWYENSPIAILESLSYLTPVIASNVAGITDIVLHGQTGLLFERGSIKELAEQMQSIIDNPHLIKTMAHAISEPKTIGADAANILGMYQTLIAS
ncbi:MAG: glycosyltransferase [Anaerolineales bacterium]|nr:glycosyltransferase [Anaerolineales bacterium]